MVTNCEEFKVRSHWGVAMATATLFSVMSVHIGGVSAAMTMAKCNVIK